MKVTPGLPRQPKLALQEALGQMRPKMGPGAGQHVEVPRPAAMAEGVELHRTPASPVQPACILRLSPLVEPQGRRAFAANCDPAMKPIDVIQQRRVRAGLSDEVRASRVTKRRYAAFAMSASPQWPGHHVVVTPDCWRLIGEPEEASGALDQQ